jgi:uncharacterized protein (DUF1330 family)
MKKGYWIAKYKEINDQVSLSKYSEKALKIIEDFGGKALVRGGKYKTLEGSEFIRIVIWEFKDLDTAIQCHESKEYKKAWSVAKKTTKRDLVIVEGV